MGIYEFERKRPPPKIENSPDEFDDYVKDDYIYCDHVYLVIFFGQDMLRPVHL